MLKKRLGIEAIEREWDFDIHGRMYNKNFFKIPSTLTIPKDCERIGSWAFFGCMNLEEVEIPESVNGIGRYAFCSCRMANIILRKPDFKFEYVGSSAFAQCSSVRYAEKETRN